MEESFAFSCSWAAVTSSVELVLAGEAAVGGLDRRWCSVQSFVLLERPTPLSYLGFMFASKKPNLAPAVNFKRSITITNSHFVKICGATS